MSLENSFLDIYEEVVEEEMYEFYSSDIEPHVDLESGNIGIIIKQTVDKYDLPINWERERPSDPLLFEIEQMLEYEEIADIIDSEPENPAKESRKRAIEDTLTRLDEGEYTDIEVSAKIGEAVRNCYDESARTAEVVGEIKDQLTEKGILEGDSIKGWKVNPQ